MIVWPRRTSVHFLQDSVRFHFQDLGRQCIILAGILEDLGRKCLIMQDSCKILARLLQEMQCSSIGVIDSKVSLEVSAVVTLTNGSWPWNPGGGTLNRLVVSMMVSLVSTSEEFFWIWLTSDSNLPIWEEHFWMKSEMPREFQFSLTTPGFRIRFSSFRCSDSSCVCLGNKFTRHYN